MLSFVRRPPVVLAIFVAIVMSWTAFLTHVVDHLDRRPRNDVVFLVALVVATLAMLTAAVVRLMSSQRQPQAEPAAVELVDERDDLHALDVDLGGEPDFWASDAALTEPTYLLPGLEHFTPWWGTEPPPPAVPARAVGMAVMYDDEDGDTTEVVATRTTTQLLEQPGDQLDERYLQGYVAGAMDQAARPGEED